VPAVVVVAVLPVELLALTDELRVGAGRDEATFADGHEPKDVDQAAEGGSAAGGLAEAVVEQFGRLAVRHPAPVGSDHDPQRSGGERAVLASAGPEPAQAAARRRPRLRRPREGGPLLSFPQHEPWFGVQDGHSCPG